MVAGVGFEPTILKVWAWCLNHLATQLCLGWDLRVELSDLVSQTSIQTVGFTSTYLVGALGIEPSQPNGNGFTDRPPSLEEYAPIFGIYYLIYTLSLK